MAEDTKASQLDEKVRELTAMRTALLNMLDDMDESRRKLELAYDELKTLDKLKSDFIDIAAHELRTPLVAVKTYIELILKGKLGKLNKLQQEKLEIGSKNLMQLTRLIDDMLEISRIEAGKLELRTEYCSISDIIELAVDELRAFVEEKHQTLTVNVPANLPALPCDAAMVTKVFKNLVSNAIEYTHYNGRIAIEVHADKAAIHLYVMDNGIGIPKSEQDKVFDKFHIVDQSLSRSERGVGLGLAIVKGIVEGHGGKIWVESAHGHGSTFHVTLPILAECETQTTSN